MAWNNNEFAIVFGDMLPHEKVHGTDMPPMVLAERVHRALWPGAKIIVASTAIDGVAGYPSNVFDDIFDARYLPFDPKVHARRIVHLRILLMRFGGLARAFADPAIQYAALADQDFFFLDPAFGPFVRQEAEEGNDIFVTTLGVPRPEAPLWVNDLGLVITRRGWEKVRAVLHDLDDHDLAGWSVHGHLGRILRKAREQVGLEHTVLQNMTKSPLTDPAYTAYCGLKPMDALMPEDAWGRTLMWLKVDDYTCGRRQMPTIGMHIDYLKGFDPPYKGRDRGTETLQAILADALYRQGGRLRDLPPDLYAFIRPALGFAGQPDKTVEAVMRDLHQWDLVLRADVPAEYRQACNCWPGNLRPGSEAQQAFFRKELPAPKVWEGTKVFSREEVNTALRKAVD